VTDPTNQTSIGGFTTFVRNVMGISANYLPDSSAYLAYAYDHALNLVNLDLACLPAQTGAWSIYAQAVYNLAGALLIETVPDQAWPVAAASWSVGLAAITTTAPNTFSPGDRVLPSGISPLAYDQPPAPGRGYYQVSAVADPTHFSYGVSPNPGTANLLPGAQVAMTYFTQARLSFKLASFFPGVVGSAGDQGTSVGMDNPEFMKGLTLMDLQLLKTPWGRAYLAIAQKSGPTVWGLN